MCRGLSLLLAVSSVALGSAGCARAPSPLAPHWAGSIGLPQRGVLTKLRQSAGQDVEGGCGQLRARALDPATSSAAATRVVHVIRKAAPATGCAGQ